MPTTISTTSSGNSSVQPITDLGATGSSYDGIAYVVTQGSAPTNYQYDVINLSGYAGNAYLASIKSHIRCDGCVATMNRSNAFSAISSSAGQFTSCASYVAAQGFVASNASSSTVDQSVSCLSQNNYRANLTSSISSTTSASVFPILYGVRVNNSSSWTSNDFETMTISWNSSATELIPHHYYSSSNSFCRNASADFTTKASTGLSGPILNSRTLRFIWCGINKNIVPAPGTNIIGNNIASYRYVPINQSLDFSNLSAVNANGSVLETATFPTTGLFALMRFGRDCYDSTKPPLHLFTPEDKSGLTGLGGLTGAFNLGLAIGTIL